MKDDKDYYWDWLKHEDNLFTNRNNFFLIAEAMLIAAVAALSDSVLQNSQPSVLLLCLAGLFVSVIWVFANLKHLVATEPKIKEKLHATELRRKEFDERRSKWWSNHWLIGMVLPLGLVLVWGIWLFILYSQGGN